MKRMNTDAPRTQNQTPSDPNVRPAGDLQAAHREWYERYQALKWDNNRAT